MKRETRRRLRPMPVSVHCKIMRICLVGLIFVLLSSVAFGQEAEGEVESLGLQGYYRPDCWVPMTVRLRPKTDTAATLQIRVIQEDMDRDRVLAVRTITLTPSVNGRATDQRFWMYFRPQVADGGLRDSAVGGSQKELEKQLKVELTTVSGKHVANLPITSGLKRVDADQQGARRLRGVRMVLCVTDGMSQPSMRDYEQMFGIAAAPVLVVMQPRELPEDARGYEMLDAMLWMGATAPDPSRSTEEPAYRAIEQYVRTGGMLVVCQSAELAKTRGFERILPVKVLESRQSDDLQPLVEMSRLNWRTPPEEAKSMRRVAFASAKPGAIVVRSKDWGEGKNSSPYLVRGAVGAGCVSWVAQDLGEPTAVRSLRGGWARIWDEMFGWRNTPTLPNKTMEDKGQTQAYEDSKGGVWVGTAFQAGGQLGMRASGYVLVAVVFFMGYWVIAGPGLYAWLALRKLATLNWFLFGLTAVGAAVLAGLVVRVIQSASPQLEHVTVLRAAFDEPAVMESRVGLYVPSDGNKRLELGKTAPNTVNWITPFPEHPTRYNGAGQFLAAKQYELPIIDPVSTDPVRVEMPWRSTMKRLQVRWNGELTGRVEGKLRLTGLRGHELEGILTNATPWDLREVYVVFRGGDLTGDGSNAGGDRLLYLPDWKKGTSVDVGRVLADAQLRTIGMDRQRGEGEPHDGKAVYGGLEVAHRGYGTEVALGEGWAGYWYSRDSVKGAGGFGDSPVEDANSGYEVSLPVCSLFDRVPPMRNARKKDGGFTDSRRDLVRVGSRWMNVSPAVAAGNLVVLAETNGPLPVPLLLDGSALEGSGTILCQFILPLSRASAPTVEPTGQK